MANDICQTLQYFSSTTQLTPKDSGLIGGFKSGITG